MDEDISLSKYRWQEFISWYEEEYHYCDWQSVSFGFIIVDPITNEAIASTYDIPEQHFVKNKIYKLSPWGKNGS